MAKATVTKDTGRANNSTTGALDAMTAADIAAARKTLGLSHAKLGDLLGYSKMQMIRYEQGTHAIPMSVSYALRWILYCRNQHGHKV